MLLDQSILTMEAVRLSDGHFLRVFALGLPRPEFAEGDEVVGEDGEADLSLGPLECSTRHPLEPAEDLHVREQRSTVQLR